MDIGRVGVWTFAFEMHPGTQVREAAAAIEDLGYGAIWIPEAADGLKGTVQKRLAWLDGLMEGRTFIAGDRFTVADIVLYCALDFGGSVGQPLDPACGRLTRWMANVAERPSAKASLHPQAGAVGMKG